MINIFCEDTSISDCTSAIVVPERALDEPGYIQTLSDRQAVSSKHEFHALSQMAYFQYQDDELEPRRFRGEVRIARDGKEESYPAAMVVYRDNQGAIHILLPDHLPAKKMLEAVYRFCTRWVRLDI